MKLIKHLLATVLLTLAIACPPQRVWAQNTNGTWNSNGAAKGWNTTTQWTNGIVAYGTNATAYFTGISTANMGSANGDWSIGHLLIGDTNTPATNTFTIKSNGNGLINVNQITVTFSNTFYNWGNGAGPAYSALKTVGPAGLIKDGPGNWLLNVNSTFSGLTTINAGALRLGQNNALTNTVNVNVAGGTLDIQSYYDTIGAVTLTSGAIVGTSGYLMGSSYDVRSGTITANLGGSGAITKSTSDTVTLSGVNTNTGPTTIIAGVLALTQYGTLASPTITVGNNAALDFSGLASPPYYLGGLPGSQTLAGSGVVTGYVSTGGGGGGVTIAPGGAGTIGTLSFSNNLDLWPCTLLFDLSGTTTPGGGVNDLIQMGGGTLTLNGVTTVVVDGPVANGTYTIIQGAGSIVGSSANFTAIGPRGSYTFYTTTVPGSVRMTVSTLPSAPLVWTGNSGNNWDVEGAQNWKNSGNPDYFYSGDSVTFDDTAVTGNVTLVGTLYPSTIAVANSGLTYTLGGSGVISGSASLTKSGSGTLILSNANPLTYTGPTLINAGTIQLTNGSNLLPSTSPVTLANAAGATLDLNGNNQTISSLSGGGVSGGTVRLGSGTLTINQAGNTSFAGGISGTGGLVNQGGGMLTLSGTGSYSGPTLVSGGNLQVNGTLSTSAVTVTGGTLSGTGTIGGATLIQSGGTLSPGGSIIGTLNIGNSLALSGTASLRINKTGTTRTSDRVQGMTGVTYGGTLAVTATGDPLAPADKFTLFTLSSGSYGGTFVSNNLPPLTTGLKWDTSGLLVDGSITVVSTNQVTTPSFSPLAGGYLGSLSVSISSDSGSTIYYTMDGSTPTTNSTSSLSPVTGISIPVGANATIKAIATKPGYQTSAVGTANYLTLSNATWINAAGGAWPLNANWQAGAIGSGSGILADFSTLSLPANAVVTLDGSQTIGSLQFRDVGNSKTWTLDTGTGGPLTLDGPAPGITVSNTATTVNAVLAGTNGFSKNGGGPLILGGANTFSGPLTINAGSVVMANTHALSDASASTVINPGGTLDLNGATPFVPEAVNAAGGGAGGLGAVVNNTTSKSGNIMVTLNNDATFGIGDPAGTIYCQWSFNGNGHKLTKTGPGLMWIYVNGGDWKFGDIDVLGGELLLDANFFVYTDTNYPASVLTVATNGVFAMTHNGGYVFSKRVVIQPGGVFNGAAGGSGTLTESFEVQGTGQTNVVLAANAGTTINGPVIGAGDLVKAGTGKLVLNGTNTYAGYTAITGGTLSLGTNASIATTPSISVVVPGVFDASGTLYPAVWTQGAGQTLIGDGQVYGNVTLNGTVSPSSPDTGSSIGTLYFAENDNVTLAGTTVMEINKDNGIANDLLYNTSGTITFGGTLRVLLTGATPLAVNDTFYLFNAYGYPGSFASIRLPAGYTWDTSQLAVSGAITVTAIGSATPPSISSVKVAGGNLTLTGHGGTPGANYWVLSSTNLATPLINWVPLTTNTFAPDGGFTNALPITPAERQRYYRLQVP